MRDSEGRDIIGVIWLENNLKCTKMMPIVHDAGLVPIHCVVIGIVWSSFCMYIMFF